MSAAPAPYVRNPEKDFTRKKKLPFETVMQLLISLGGNSLYKELLESQGYDVNTATTSAFVGQRNKILTSAVEFLFHEFTESYTDIKDYRGYRLLAIDGSDLHIATDSADTDTYFQSQPNTKGYNLLHLNATYDLCNRLYVDAIVQPRRLCNEGSRRWLLWLTVLPSREKPLLLPIEVMKVTIISRILNLPLLPLIFWICMRTCFTRFPFGLFVSSCLMALMKPSLRIFQPRFSHPMKSHVVISQLDKRHPYQVNFTVAVYVCRHFLRSRDDEPPHDVEALIRKTFCRFDPFAQGSRIRAKFAGNQQSASSTE